MPDFLHPFDHPKGERDAKGRFEPFDVPRRVMPQIEEADYPALFEYLEQNGVTTEPRLFHPDELSIHQQMERLSVAKMPLEVARKPVLASADLYVLDGNHRLEWHRLEGVMVDAIVLSASFAEAIELLCHFPMVKTVGAYTRGAQ